MNQNNDRQNNMKREHDAEMASEDEGLNGGSRADSGSKMWILWVVIGALVVTGIVLLIVFLSRKKKDKSSLQNMLSKLPASGPISDKDRDALVKKIMSQKTWENLGKKYESKGKSAGKAAEKGDIGPLKELAKEAFGEIRGIADQLLAAVPRFDKTADQLVVDGTNITPLIVEMLQIVRDALTLTIANVDVFLKDASDILMFVTGDEAAIYRRFHSHASNAAPAQALSAKIKSFATNLEPVMDKLGAEFGFAPAEVREGLEHVQQFLTCRFSQ